MTIIVDYARKIIAAATPGPWFIQYSHRHEDYSIFSYAIGFDACLASRVSSGTDANFVITARDLLPAALDEIESLRKQVAERDATIAELGSALSAMRVASRNILNSITDSDDGRPGDGACFAYSGACEAADAVLAKTAPKEGA